MARASIKYVLLFLTLTACEKNKSSGSLSWRGLQSPLILQVQLKEENLPNKSFVGKGNFKNTIGEGYIKIVERPISSELEAKKIYAADMNAIQSLYQPTRVLYAGVISKEVNCPLEYQPIEIQLEASPGLRAGLLFYKSSRRTGGVCKDEDLAFSSLEMVLYCNAVQKLYEITVDLPGENKEPLKAIFESFVCPT